MVQLSAAHLNPNHFNSPVSRTFMIEWASIHKNNYV